MQETLKYIGFILLFIIVLLSSLIMFKIMIIVFGIAILSVLFYLFAMIIFWFFSLFNKGE